MTDGNIGAALQRLPGISVDEDQDGSQGAFNIRGISGDFNSFQIDGNRAPTSGGSRSFDARQLAADGITNIEVIKAPTPDRDGDAIGGIVNVVSRTAFQRDGRSMKLKASAVLNDQPDKWGHAATFSFSDLYSVGGGEKNLGISFTASNYKTDRYSINADLDWVQVTPANNPQLNLGQYDLDRPIWFMEATHWEYDTRATKTYGLNGSIDFRTDEHNSFYIRPLFSHFTRNGITFETDIDVDTRFQDAVGGRKTYAELTPTYGRGTPGNSGSRGSMGWIGTDDERENDLYSVAIGGRHERDASLLTYDFYYSRSKQTISSDLELNMLMEPDDPWMLWEYELTRPWTGDARINLLSGQDPRDLSLMTEGELIDETSVKTEDVLSARLDWEKKFTRDAGVFTLKTGAKYRSSEPKFDLSAIVHEMDEDFPYASVLEPTNQVLFAKQKYWDVYPRRGLDLLRSNPSLFELNEEDTLADSNLEDYDAKEETSAAYLMGTYQFGKHTILGGVRYEKVDWSNVNKQASYLNGVPTVTTVNHGDSYSHWLPGLHLRHALTDNLVLRESYNRSYGRPQLGELTMGRFVDEDGNIEDGNPELQPALSDNFDIQLEYYTKNGGLYSVGFFYKKVKDFTFTQVYDFDVLGADGIPIPADGGDFEYERPVNGTTATNYGWELIARQRLFFLPGMLSGFSTSLSATFTESEADYPNRTDRDDLALEGFSDYIFTGSLEYAWGNFRARLDYRYRSDYIEGLGDDIESDEFYAAEERVDAELSYRLRKNLSVFVNGTNLTNRPQVAYQGYGFFVEDTSYAGRKYTFGVEYSF
jgi:TonB-dependent receptor